MWILPKQLHTLASVQDTGALSLDLNESSHLCAQSLFVRSNPSPLRTWLQKWKRDSWTQHLYGRILKPSLGKAFEIEWTSLLAVTPANLSAQQESELGKTTQDTCGPGLQMELLQCDQNYVSLKTSKDISRWGCPTLSRTWQEWVIERRGAYSARLNAVRRTSAKECSLWPTAMARDWKDTTNCSLDSTNPDGTHRNRRDRLTGAIAAESHWPTPTAMEAEKAGLYEKGQMGQSLSAMANRGEISGPPAPANPSTHGSRLESWLTPRANEPTADANFVARNADRGEHCHVSLTMQAKSWSTPTVTDASAMSPEMRPSRIATGRTTEYLARQIQWGTPTARDHKSGRGKEDRNYKELTPMVERTQSGKLNPRWVETLMGLPVGWTMPNCASPVTIELTNCASLAMESSQPQQH
jgi:hypothetical protein